MSMTLPERANTSMATLAMKFELATGNRIRWRNAPEGMAAILNMSLHSGKQELIKLADEVLDYLSDGWLQELAARGLSFPVGHSAANRITYRGAAATGAAVTRSTDSSKTLYRGARVETGDAEAQSVPAAKTKRMYRGRVIED